MASLELIVRSIVSVVLLVVLLVVLYVMVGSLFLKKTQICFIESPINWRLFLRNSVAEF